VWGFNVQHFSFAEKYQLSGHAYSVVRSIGPPICDALNRETATIGEPDCRCRIPFRSIWQWRQICLYFSIPCFLGIG